MEEKEALQVLINVANLAQSKGVLSIEDAVIVHKAIRVFVPKNEENETLEVETAEIETVSTEE